MNKEISSTYVSSLYSNGQFISDEWILDLGCIMHMSFQKDKFQFLHKHKYAFVIIGDIIKLEVHGIGNVCINGRIIDNILYVLILEGIYYQHFKLQKRVILLN